MNCCQCQGIEELFSREYVTKELDRYRARGPERTTRMLAEAIEQEGVEGLTLLDIGGGLGAVGHELLAAGVQHATNVEAASAYVDAARAEAQRRGLAERLTVRHGNFVDLAGQIPPADIVTLDRVICCYHDMEKLVSLSAVRARQLYGLVYPRDTWWMKLVIGIENLYFRLRRSPYRAFVHPTAAVHAIATGAGLQPHSLRRTLLWQVVVYTR